MSNNGHNSAFTELVNNVTNGIVELEKERDELKAMLDLANDAIVLSQDLIAAQRAIIEECSRRTWRPTPAESAEWRRMMKRGKK